MQITSAGHPNVRHQRRTAGRVTGFTLIEMVMGVTLISAMSAIVYPQLGPTIRSYRIAGASRMVAMDLQAALSAASRERRPVRFTFNGATASYVIVSLTTGDTLTRRALGPQAEVPVDGVTAVPSVVDIYPTGRTSSAVTITLSTAARTRVVTMSSAGLVRVVN